ncbi:hypothetical protein [Pseudarthrobacter sulfonivorans]|uniref:hypothetical protein n=1 Tax=Pseudarthrobacter sulfonivorans TaxID=121292 RepID=UPI00210432C1|nr:hypothetical protein [Pseudarthrobacter sulfonivorans]
MENNVAHEYHVTYFDTDCGRIRYETFDSRLEAERFATRQCTGEEAWAVIDEIATEQARLAA